MIRLKELREEAGMNMRQAAAALNIPYTTYVSYEKGEREPNLKMLINLAIFFNCTIDYLLKHDNTDTRNVPEDFVYSEERDERSISMENIPLRGCDGAKIEQVIVTRALKGSGTESDPYREVTQYWTLDGEFLFEKVT